MIGSNAAPLSVSSYSTRGGDSGNGTVFKLTP